MIPSAYGVNSTWTGLRLGLGVWRGIRNLWQLICVRPKDESEFPTPNLTTRLNIIIYRLVKKLALKSDILLENFKPGTLEKWGLGPSSLHPYNPSLIFTRVSGYGQTGPWASRPGYASVCEAESGFRYINGFPEGGGPPVRPNMSLGDSVAGLHAAFGTVLALLARKKGGGGRVVDVSIMERYLSPLYI